MTVAILWHYQLGTELMHAWRTLAKTNEPRS
jgi:hypothetical protein